jgi:hypothetical protein
VALAASSITQSAEIRLARIRDPVNPTVGSEANLESLRNQARTLRGPRFNDQELGATERNLQEINEFTKQPRHAAERQEMLSRFQASLRLPQDRGDGITEFPLMPQYVGENVEGFENWHGQGSRTPGESYRTGNGQAVSRPVRYLTEQEREQSRVYLHNGKFVDAKGKSIVHDRFIFVVDRKGRLLVASKEGEVRDGTVHHSSLSGGEPVLMAGEIAIAFGKLEEVTNRSGHFRPDQEAFQHFLGELRVQGALTVTHPYASVQNVEVGAHGHVEFQPANNNLFDHPEVLQPGAGRMLTSLTFPENLQSPVRPADAPSPPPRPQGQEHAPPAESPDPYFVLPDNSPPSPANTPQSRPRSNSVGNPPTTRRAPPHGRGAEDLWTHAAGSEWRLAA